MGKKTRQKSVLPGLGLSLGYTVFYLSLVVLVPLGSLFLKASGASWGQWVGVLRDERVWAAFKLTFGAALVGALVNGVFGLVVAWMLARYEFWGKRIVDAMVDLPFALPTAVSGIALSAIYAPNGWVGRWLEPLGVKVAYAPMGVVVALTFIGLPFVVRTLQPAIAELEPEWEEAAASLGATRWQTIMKVMLPPLVPALLTGVTLAFARAVGEYGSVIFISGGLRMKTEIVPQLIIEKLEQYDYEGATILGVLMLVVSFVMLLGINALQWWSSRRYQEGV